MGLFVFLLVNLSAMASAHLPLLHNSVQIPLGLARTVVPQNILPFASQYSFTNRAFPGYLSSPLISPYCSVPSVYSSGINYPTLPILRNAIYPSLIPSATAGVQPGIIAPASVPDTRTILSPVNPSPSFVPETNVVRPVNVDGPPVFTVNNEGTIESTDVLKNGNGIEVQDVFKSIPQTPGNPLFGDQFPEVNENGPQIPVQPPQFPGVSFDRVPDAIPENPLIDEQLGMPDAIDVRNFGSGFSENVPQNPNQASFFANRRIPDGSQNVPQVQEQDNVFKEGGINLSQGRNDQAQSTPFQGYFY